MTFTKLPDVDMEELALAKKKNFEERLAFIDAYAAWVKKTPNKIWSAQQKKLIG